MAAASSIVRPFARSMTKLHVAVPKPHPVVKYEMSSITAPGPTFSSNVPWFGLGGSAGSGAMVPTTTPYIGQGTYTYTIPTWANHLDLIPLGAGGAGQGGGFVTASTGGYPGSFNPQTVTLGNQIPRSTTQLTIVVGAGGAEGGPGDR